MQFKDWLLQEERVMLPLPLIKQTSSYDCGPAALKTILSYFKVGPKNYNQFVKECGTTEETGTDPKNLIKVAKFYGLKTKEYYNLSINQLEKLLDENKPVIIDIQAWGEKPQIKNLSSGHYAIAIGYDDKKIHFRDPFYLAKNSRSMNKKEFLKIWKDKKTNGEILKQYGIAFWKN